MRTVLPDVVRTVRTPDLRFSNDATLTTTPNFVFLDARLIVLSNLPPRKTFTLPKPLPVPTTRATSVAFLIFSVSTALLRSAST